MWTNVLDVWKDFSYWYKIQAPKYGHWRSLGYCVFNAAYFKRDGSFRLKTNGEPNETK